MRRLALLPLLVAALVAPAAATAAPKIDHAVILSAVSPTFAWDGEQATAAAPQQSSDGFDPNKCTKESDYYCEVSLVRLEAREGTTATVEFAINQFSPAFADFDISIFKSDAAGEPGDQIANGGNLSAAGMEETVPIPDMEPGYYLVTVSYYFSPDATYKGTMKATGITPPPAAAGPPTPAPASPPPSGQGASPQPAGAGRQPLPFTVAASGGSAKAVNRRRALTLKATARTAITNLSLVLRDRAGRVVATGRAARFAAGTRPLRLKATRKLRRGTYSLTAIGIAEGAKRTVVKRVVLRR
jgi:hypothetical protein